MVVYQVVYANQDISYKYQYYKVVKETKCYVFLECIEPEPQWLMRTHKKTYNSKLFNYERKYWQDCVSPRWIELLTDEKVYLELEKRIGKYNKQKEFNNE